MESYIGDARLPIPRPLIGPAAPLTARLNAGKNKARDATVRADIAALPGQLDRVDLWIEEGLIGGEQPNAADLQIGSTIRLLVEYRRLAPADRRPPRRGIDEVVPADRGRGASGRAASRVVARDRVAPATLHRAADRDR